MITVKQAVDIAARHLKDLFPNAEHITLEETEVSDDDKFFLITLGYLDRDYPETSSLITTPVLSRSRKYKVFKIDRETGNVRSMKIREKENV